MTDIASYIEQEFGRERADRFEYDTKRKIREIGFLSGIFGNTHIYSALTLSLRKHSHLPSFFI